MDVIKQEKNYVLIGKITDQSLLAKFYSMADVFIICSKGENFPTTCIEAQCCGTPVIGFDVGGTKTTSLLGEDDFVKYGALEDLQTKLLKKLSGEDVPDIHAQAQMTYSKEAMTAKYINIYESLSNR